MAKSQQLGKDFSTEKIKVLEVAFAQIDKEYGKGSVMVWGSGVQENVETVSTGSIAINQALGIGGLPRGRVIEIYGPESSGITLAVTLPITVTLPWRCTDSPCLLHRILQSPLGSNLIHRPHNCQRLIQWHYLALKLSRSQAAHHLSGLIVETVALKWHLNHFIFLTGSGDGEPSWAE